MNAKNYLLRTLIYALVGGCLVVGLNYSVDPYGITGMPRVPGFNEYKVEINEHTRVLKKYQPLLSSHNALVVGNSRVELGISPEHACFRRNRMTVYNLGVPGAGVGAQLAYALNLMYQQPISTVFLSVDFTDFIATDRQAITTAVAQTERQKGEFRFTAAGEYNADYPWAVMRDYIKSLFSLDALVASIKTIVLQSAASPDRDAAGFNPARDFGENVRVEGPRALFDQKMASLREKYSRPWYFRGSEGELHVAMADLDAFLDIAEAQGVQVYLFTNPFHDSFWELIRDHGHTSVYEDWMRSIDKLVRSHPDLVIEFWDFAGDSPYIHEPVPPAGVRSGPLEWFWEPAHYRRELGDLMVNTMLSERCDTEAVFGRRIFPSSSSK